MSTLGAVQLVCRRSYLRNLMFYLSLISGNTSGHLASIQTPEVIRLFGKREPKQLRERLLLIEHEAKLNKISLENKNRQKAEILTALRQLGEQLAANELQFLESYNDVSNAFKNVEFVEIKNE